MTAVPVRAARWGQLAALIAVGAYGVHQLRYLLAYGGDAGRQLAGQGHGYLGSVVPALAVLTLAAVAASGVLALARSTRGPGSALGRALGCAAVVLAVFCAQELLEGALSPGHPSGVAALVAGGGWIALPLSLAFGALASLGLRGLERIERLVTRLVRRAARVRGPLRTGRSRPARALSPLRSPLAFGLARRPPPLPA